MGFDHPATGSIAVSPNNSTDLVKFCRALYVGVTGDIAVMLTDGSTQLFLNVPVGILPVQCKRVLLTGTTATGIVALL